MSTIDRLLAQADLHRAKSSLPMPIMIAKAEGVWLESVDGVRYLDMISGYGALNQGHCHPRIVEALRRQAGRAALLSDALYHDQQARLYEMLSALTQKDLVFLANSGVEAVETALKVARRWGYRVKGVRENCAEIIVSDGDFHGRTITAISSITDPLVRADFGPHTPGFKSVPFANLEELGRAITPNTVAFLTEPIQGRGGICVPPVGFLRDALDLCRRNGVLFLADEVQTGFGRTGKRFCCDWEGVTPDIYILGKALGAGIYPVSAVCADEEVLGVLGPGSHGTTYGANPLACAVALAALEVIEEEALAERAHELGEYFADRLRGLGSPVIKDVRGRGLFIGLELTRPVEAYRADLRRRGILCAGMGLNFRLLPALVITREELDWALERLGDALAEEL